MPDLAALPIITAHLRARPSCLCDRPFPVPPDLYRHGEAEMENLMRERGFPKPVELNLKRGGQDNFLLFGVPIVSGDQ